MVLRLIQMSVILSSTKTFSNNFKKVMRKISLLYLPYEALMQTTRWLLHNFSFNDWPRNLARHLICHWPKVSWSQISSLENFITFLTTDVSCIWQPHFHIGVFNHTNFELNLTFSKESSASHKLCRSQNFAEHILDPDTRKTGQTIVSVIKRKFAFMNGKFLYYQIIGNSPFH